MAEQIRINLDEPTLAALPAGWDDERSEDSLWGQIARALIDDAPTLAPSTIKTRRGDWARLRKALEPAGINSLESFRDPEDFSIAVSALRDASKKRILGNTANTLNHTLDTLKCGLRRLGLEESHLVGLKAASRTIKRASGLTASETPPLTPEDVVAMFSTLDDWLSRPEVMAPSRQTVLDGVILSRGARAKRSRVLRLKAWVSIAIHYGIRTGDLSSMAWDDIDSDEIRWTVAKGRDYPEPVSRPMHPVVWDAIQEWRDVAGNSPLWGHVETMSRDTRCLMLESGISEHNGRLGLHRVRGSIATASAAAGLSMFDAASALSHKDSRTTERTYAKADGRNQAAVRSLSEWHDQIKTKPVSPGAWIDGEIIRFEEPFCNHPETEEPILSLYRGIASKWHPAAQSPEAVKFREGAGQPLGSFRMWMLTDRPVENRVDHDGSLVSASDGAIGLGFCYETTEGMLGCDGRPLPTSKEWARPDLNRGLGQPTPLADGSPEALLSLVASAARTAIDDPTATDSLLALLSTLDGGGLNL